MIMLFVFRGQTQWARNGCGVKGFVDEMPERCKRVGAPQPDQSAKGMENAAAHEKFAAAIFEVLCREGAILCEHC